jgi:hypothetical protein
MAVEAGRIAWGLAVSAVLIGGCNAVAIAGASQAGALTISPGTHLSSVITPNVEPREGPIAPNIEPHE